MASTIDEALAKVPLFSSLDDATRSVLAARVDEERYETGRTLFSRGDPGESMFVVLEGEVEIFVKNDTGDKIVLEVSGPGDFFGEASMFDPGPRNASAIVTKDLHALVIDQGDLDELLHHKPDAAMMLLSAMGRRLREASRLLRGTASRNANVEEQDKRTVVMRVADWISEFSGSLPFLFLHLVIFAVWIGLNVGPLLATSIGGFDPFPFGLLTMAVSLEAIILSVFVLLSQNRQVARDRVRNDIEYNVNLRAELEITHLHEKMDHMNAELLAKLRTLELRLDGSANERSSR